MKKLGISLFLVVFLAFSIFGYFIGQQKDQPASPKQIATPTGRETFLIIRVNNFDVPRLISVWMLFLSPSIDQTHTSMLFKPLYPSVNSKDEKAPLGDLFALDAHNKPTEPFWQGLKKYNIEWSNFVVIDSTASQILVSWLSGDVPDMHSVPAFSPEERTSMLNGEYNLLKTICNHLVSTEEIPQPKPAWSLLYPSHLMTDLTMSAIQNQWEKITSRSSLPSCETLNPTKN